MCISQHAMGQGAVCITACNGVEGGMYPSMQLDRGVQLGTHMTTEVGGTHPTGMHSCFLIANLVYSSHKLPIMVYFVTSINGTNPIHSTKSNSCVGIVFEFYTIRVIFVLYR